VVRLRWNSRLIAKNELCGKWSEQEIKWRRRKRRNRNTPGSFRFHYRFLQISFAQIKRRQAKSQEGIVRVGFGSAFKPSRHLPDQDPSLPTACHFERREKSFPNKNATNIGSFHKSEGFLPLVEMTTMTTKIRSLYIDMRVKWVVGGGTLRSSQLERFEQF
jgi:hypothetical protein